MKKIFKVTGEKIGKIIGIMLTLLLVAAVAVVVYIMTCNMRGKTAEIFGKCVMKVVTGSMEPSIHSGDYILIEKIDTDKLKVSDVICFYSTDSDIYGMPNTHRITKVLSDGSFVTKGDANTTADDTVVTPDRVIGIYVGKVRLLRWINSFTSGRKLLMILVIIPMSCIAVYEFITVARIKAQTEEEAKQAALKERERLIREAIDAEKKRLYEENYSEEKAEQALGKEADTADEPRKDNEG